MRHLIGHLTGDDGSKLFAQSIDVGSFDLLAHWHDSREQDGAAVEHFVAFQFDDFLNEKIGKSGEIQVKNY